MAEGVLKIRQSGDAENASPGAISATLCRRTSRMSPGQIVGNMLVPVTASLAWPEDFKISRNSWPSNSLRRSIIVSTRKGQRIKVRGQRIKAKG